MRGLLQAALLLAPALARGNPLPSNEDAIPSAYIRLHPFEEDVSEVTFRLDINESKDACGYANLTINGETLPQGGRGLLTLDEGTTVIANWNFTCVAWNGQAQEQLMSLSVDSVDGKTMQDLGFTIRFQQVAPVWISDVEGPATMTRMHKAKLGHDCASDKADDAKSELDDELAELEYLRYQLFELHGLVRMKERHLAEAFGWEHEHRGHHGHHRPQGKGARPFHPSFNAEAGYLRDCDSISCVFNSIYHKVRNAAVAFYGEVAEYEDFFDGPGGPGRHEGPGGHGDKPGHGKPGKKFPHHGPGNDSHPFPPHRSNHTHGNHTFPPPPWRPHHPPGKVPFHPPPFCRCPSSPPHHPPPPSGSPGDKEPPKDGFPGSPFPGHHQPPPPGDDNHDDEPPKHEFLGERPPPKGPKGGEEPTGHDFPGEHPPPPPSEDGEEPPKHGFPGEHRPPPPPQDGEEPPRHGFPGDHPPEHGFPGEHPPEHGAPRKGGFPGERLPHHQPEHGEHESNEFRPFEDHHQKGHGHGPDREHGMPHPPFDNDAHEHERPLPPPEDGREDGPRGPHGPGHHGPPGPPPFEGPDGPPPPPPGHGPPDFDGPDGPPPRHADHGFFGLFDGPDGPPPPPPGFDGPEGVPPPPPPPPGHGPPFGGPDGGMPPPPPGFGPPSDGPDGHGPPGFHGHGPHGHGGPHGPHGRPPILSPVKIGVMAILLFVLTAALHKRACMKFRGSRAERLAARREAWRRHHARGFFGRLFFGRYPRYWDDEDEDEKARLLRLGGDDKYDCTRTESVAQEISSFRAAADVVSEMVAAEEGRVQQQQQQQHLAVPQSHNVQSHNVQVVRNMQEQQANAAALPPLPSPNSAFAHYMTGLEDEALPAYEYVRGEGSDSVSLVSDGFSDYTPSSTGSRPAAGSGADDVLGDTKH